MDFEILYILFILSFFLGVETGLTGLTGWTEKDPIGACPMDFEILCILFILSFLSGRGDRINRISRMSGKRPDWGMEAWRQD